MSRHDPFPRCNLKKLSTPQRELLLAHLDRAVAVIRTSAAHSALMAQGLIRPVKAAILNPTHTVLSERGREALGYLLGEYADALVRAGFLDLPPAGETPMQVLLRTKAERLDREAYTAATPEAQQKILPLRNL